ncbi:hypothetical protein Q8G48_28380, partial [Klebsiella pneumoniae]|uniref:hypothetical protein n=1 Tax=Klebsiella pneumoniae TaxID=573 RepID=UPI003013A759
NMNTCYIAHYTHNQSFKKTRKTGPLNIFVEVSGPGNVCPIIAFGPNAIIGCPTCLYLHTSTHPARADITHHQRVPYSIYSMRLEL